MLSIYLIPGVIETSKFQPIPLNYLFRPEFSIGHSDQKGVPSGSANGGGCCLHLSGASQKLMRFEKFCMRKGAANSDLVRIIQTQARNPCPYSITLYDSTSYTSVALFFLYHLYLPSKNVPLVLWLRSSTW